MVPLKSEFEKSAVYTVPYVKQTTQETSTKTSDLKIKLCGGIIITALLVGGMVTAAFLLSPSGLKTDENPVSPNVKTYEATFQVDGKDKREDVRIDHDSEIAIFEDLTDEFTVVLDYRRSLAVFKNLRNNTCYFTNLEDIPMIGNMMQQEDEERGVLFFLTDDDDDQVQRNGTLTIDSTLVLPGDYVAKTNKKVVSNMCARSTSFWGRAVVKPATKESIRQKRQFGFDPNPYPPIDPNPPIGPVGPIGPFPPVPTIRPFPPIPPRPYCPCWPWGCCYGNRCCIIFRF